MNLALKPTVKKELNTLIATKTIFPIRRIEWVANLVLVGKNNGDIRLCINF